MLQSLQIKGLRGFIETQTLLIPQPNGELGSGLLTIVGSNNSGKTTIIEALRSFLGHGNPSFSQGRRNVLAGDEVSIKMFLNDGEISIKSSGRGSSETDLTGEHQKEHLSRGLYILQSRRAFNPFFGKADYSRQQFIQNNGLPSARASELSSFTYRLFTARKNQARFNEILFEILGHSMEWTIDQSDNGNYFLKVVGESFSHSSEGLGEGIISVFFIVDALYDSTDGDCIVIDEPELSLHPALQKRLFSVLLKQSASKQIVVTTHSPYFLDLSSLEKGGSVARVAKRSGGSFVYQISDRVKVSGLLSNVNNPHIFGLEAREVFFSADRIILTEGQEDVVYYRKVQKDLGFSLEEQFYGWGVGGASNMRALASLLSGLGYEKVVGVLDGDKIQDYEKLRAEFPHYHFKILPVDDIRNKDAVKPKDPVIGLLDDKRALKEEYREFALRMFEDINNYLND